MISMAVHKKASALYQEGTEYQFATREITLGPWTSYSMMTDPKHMSFVLARYKFVAKMLEHVDKRNILEVGCGDGIGLPIVASIANMVWAADWDERLVEGNKRRLDFLTNVKYKKVDFNKETATDLGRIDAVYAIDVIEHLDPKNEENFMSNVVQCITNKVSGTMLVGTPNITAAQYASPQSKTQHINLKDMDTLRELMEKFFHNVFMFGMNDEILHTGYASMCHYIWALGCGVKKIS